MVESRFSIILFLRLIGKHIIKILNFSHPKILSNIEQQRAT